MKDFARLRSRLKLIERRYNPKDENLHFACFSHGDADLYPELLSLAVAGLKTVKRRHAYFANHALYADGMFWYDLFLAISAASHRVRADNAQRYIPEELVNKLTSVLVQIARYTTIEDLDITSRNYEALANTLLTFYSNDRIRAIRKEVKPLPAPAKRLIKEVIRRVEELRTCEKKTLKNEHKSNAETE